MSDSASASPAPVANVQTQKRPLEEHSSDAGFEDQHDAKRPALGIRDIATNGAEADQDRVNDETIANPDAVTPEEGKLHIATDAQDTNGASTIEGAEGDAAADYVPLKVQTLEEEAAFMQKESDEFIAQQEAMETQPIQSTTTANGTASSGSPFPEKQDESKWLHVRAIISGPEAATLIGKGGENVGLIRKESGAKCTVSEYSRGAVERILTVSGQAEAIAKAFGLIIRTLNQEDMKTPSTETSKTYALRLLIPHVLMGSIIGRQGIRIREIQDQSGARLNASEPSMPLSSERSLVILGVADAVHIASFYVCSTLVEQLTDRFGGPAASAYATRGGKPAGVVPGGLQVIPYTPQPAGGQWGSPDSYQRHPATQPGRQPANRYGIPYAQSGGPIHHQQHPAMQYGAGASPRGGYGTPTSQAAQPYGQQSQVPQQGYAGPPQQPTGGPANAALPGQPLTQQIYIPNDMVGAIIGKGGAKINEIRQLSGSVIKINEPQDNSNERLVTITGTQQCNQMALYMLYQRLGSSQPNPTR